MHDAKTIDISAEACRLMDVKIMTASPVMLSLYAEEAANFIRALAADRDRLAAENAMFLEQLAHARGENRNADLQVIMAANNELSTQLTAALKRAKDAERERKKQYVRCVEQIGKQLVLASDLIAANATVAKLKEDIGSCGCVGGCEQAPQSGPIFYGRLCAAYDTARPLPTPPSEETK